MMNKENSVHNLSNEQLNEVNGASWFEQEIDHEWYAKSNYISYDTNEKNEQYQFLFK